MGRLTDLAKAAAPDPARAVGCAVTPIAAAEGRRLPGLPSLSPASESRRQKLLALLARDGNQYAVLVEEPNTNPVVMALATPDGTCELLIPKHRYDPFAIMSMVDGWNREPEPRWWRVAIQEPGGRTVEVDTPSGYTPPEWAAYAERYHGRGCVVTALRALPKPPQAPVNLDETLRAACEGVGGITPAQFRALLSPEDLDDIEGGETLRAYALSFAGRVVVLP